MKTSTKTIKTTEKPTLCRVPRHPQNLFFLFVKMYFKANITFWLEIALPPKWGKLLHFSSHSHDPDERHPQLSPRLPQLSVLSTFNMIERPSSAERWASLINWAVWVHWNATATSYLWPSGDGQGGLGENYTALRLISIIHNASDAQMHIFYHV